MGIAYTGLAGGDYGMGHDQNTNEFWVLDGHGVHGLVKVNARTGDTIVVNDDAQGFYRTLNEGGGDPGVTWHRGKLYILPQQNAGTPLVLYAVNIDTGEATDVGELAIDNFGHENIGLASDPIRDRLYVGAYTSNQIHQIELGDDGRVASTTLLCPDVTFNVLGMAFSRGLIYGAPHPRDGDYTMWTLDPSTCIKASLGSLSQFNNLEGLAGGCLVEG